MAEVRAEESEMAKELRELKKLRDDGVIDESLFMEKSRQVLGLPALPAKRKAPPAATPPPKMAKPPPPAQPASIDLTNDTEAPPPAAAPPVAPPVAPPAAMPPPIAALLTAARAIAQPPRGITSNPAALARFPAHDREVLEKRDLWDAVDATFGQDSDDDSEPPEPFKGSFTDWEDAKYLELLIRYGQPLKANPPAMKKFLEEFGYRAKASVTAHVNAFNVGAYKAWRAANGGRWAGFAWVKN
jgi:hypothetical protein